MAKSLDRSSFITAERAAASGYPRFWVRPSQESAAVAYLMQFGTDPLGPLARSTASPPFVQVQK